MLLALMNLAIMSAKPSFGSDTIAVFDGALEGYGLVHFAHMLV